MFPLSIGGMSYNQSVKWWLVNPYETEPSHLRKKLPFWVQISLLWCSWSSGFTRIPFGTEYTSPTFGRWISRFTRSFLSPIRAKSNRRQDDAIDLIIDGWKISFLLELRQCSQSLAVIFDCRSPYPWAQKWYTSTTDFPVQVPLK